MQSYFNCHSHTVYSNIRLIDSINQPEELIDKAIELGLSGIAITDHECLSAHVRAEKYMKTIQEKYPDFVDRGYTNENCTLKYGLDFLSDDYLIEKADVVIMNPPYATLEPFLIRGLEIAQEKLIVLCRTQALEGISRYNKIFSKNPPSDIYQYIERVQCWKNGKKPTGSSAQAYCWLVWDKAPGIQMKHPQLHWIHRAD